MLCEKCGIDKPIVTDKIDREGRVISICQDCLQMGNLHEKGRVFLTNSTLDKRVYDHIRKTGQMWVSDITKSMDMTGISGPSAIRESIIRLKDRGLIEIVGR